MSSHDRCSQCVLSAAFPNITFDPAGVCNFCRDEMIATSEKRCIESARAQVEKLVSQARTSGAQYDAILCNSGGKDSSYTLALAVQTYGLKVLSFTLDNGFIPEGAFANIHRITGALGVDHISVRPNPAFFAAVIRTAALRPVYNPKTLLRISAGCNSCISLVNTTAVRFALEKRIPLIVAGFTVGQIPANAIVYRNHYRFLADSRKESLGLLRDAVGPEVDRHFTISDQVLDAASAYPHNINLLCLEDLSEDMILDKVESLGWVRPDGVDGCSSNCELNTFNNFVHQKSKGYNPYELELSHLIRKGLLTREQALLKMADQPTELLGSIADRLELSAEEAEKLGIER